MQVLARALARGVGAGVATLDCPGHGDRRPAGARRRGFNALVQAHMTDPAVFDQLADEWPLVAAAARVPTTRRRPAHSPTPASRWGASSDSAWCRASTTCASCCSRSAACSTRSAPDPEAAARNATRNRIIRDGAARFGDRQVLMTNMTHDEHFPIAGALEVFGAASRAEAHGRVGRHPRAVDRRVDDDGDRLLPRASARVTSRAIIDRMELAIDR